jgi:hypothetical protein
MATQPLISSELRVREVNPLTDPAWDAFVAAHPDGVVYHHALWLRVLTKTFGYEPLGLVAEDDTGLYRGVLPLMQTHGLLTGRGLTSLPRTAFSGPLALDKPAAAALVAAAMERVSAEPGSRLRMKLPAPVLDGMFDQLPGVPSEIRYVLRLPVAPEELRFGNAKNRGRIRSKLIRAARAGLRVRAAQDKDELRAWYRLYLDTMRWHTAPPRPLRFFENAWDILRPHGLMRTLLAENDGGKLLAGGIYFLAGKTVLYAFNGRDEEALASAANDALQWEAIHHAWENGFRWYDFGSVPEDNAGLARFKEKWGAQAAWTFSYEFPAPRRLKVVSHPGASKLKTLVWRRLPLKLTAAIGNWIYSYL